MPLANLPMLDALKKDAVSATGADADLNRGGRLVPEHGGKYKRVSIERRRLRKPILLRKSASEFIAKEDTSEGARKGWETRRRGGVGRGIGIDMGRAKAEGLEWAKEQLVRLKSEGWKQRDIEHHILSELGRNYNIGVQLYVQKKLGLRFLPKY